jgi:alkylation response protein AidB-like acyl-CoA dehydrogenase
VPLVPVATEGSPSVTYLPTADHDELRAVVRELAEERIAPRATEIGERGEFPWDLKELLAQ